MIQKLDPEDCLKRQNFCKTLLAEMASDETIAERLVFSDEAAFDTRSKVNRHDLRVWVSEYRVTFEHQRNSPKMNVYCAISRSKVYCPFFCVDDTINGINYLDMLQNLLMPQLMELDLKAKLPDCWIGRAGALPTSPDLTRPHSTSLNVTPFCGVT
jgi:hypothetical protein